MIADEPMSPTMIGLDPAMSAGNMNVARMKPAKANPSNAAKPRQRATTMTTAAKINPTTSSGVLRVKSENWY
jgi:hypothetical protein